MAMTLEEANALLLEERSKTMQAAGMFHITISPIQISDNAPLAAAGKMLVQNVDQLSKEAVELRAEVKIKSTLTKLS